jgi:hypothetical protein
MTGRERQPNFGDIFNLLKDPKSQLILKTVEAVFGESSKVTRTAIKIADFYNEDTKALKEITNPTLSIDKVIDDLELLDKAMERGISTPETTRDALLRASVRLARTAMALDNKS